VPLLRPAALERALSRGELGGAFFLFGSEPYLCEEAAAAIVAAHLDPATRDFNLDQLRGSEARPEDLASVLQTPPMMARWRVVVLREVQALATAPRLRATIEEVVERPPSGLALVLIAQIPESAVFIGTVVTLEKFGFGFGAVGHMIYMMQQLAPGRYRWVVWPGFGPRSKSNYGQALGPRTFRVSR
jgi:hypothetical protein